MSSKHQSRIDFDAPQKSKQAQKYRNPLADSTNDLDQQVSQLLKEWTDDTPRYHQVGMDNNEKLLQLFDNKVEYGPPKGLSRLERYERAVNLDRTPPQVIKTLLQSSDKYLTSAYD